MVFSEEDKAIIKHYYKDKGWTPYSIWKNSRDNRPFANENEMITRIKSMWNEVARDTEEIQKAMKQFVPCLKAVEENRGYSIKTVFG